MENLQAHASSKDNDASPEPFFAKCLAAGDMPGAQDSSQGSPTLRMSKADLEVFRKFWEQRSASCSGGTASFLHCQDIDGDEYLLTFREDPENMHEYTVVGCGAVIVKFQAQAGDILVFASKTDGTVLVGTHRLNASAFLTASGGVADGHVLQERCRNVVDESRKAADDCCPDPLTTSAARGTKRRKLPEHSTQNPAKPQSSQDPVRTSHSYISFAEDCVVISQTVPLPPASACMSESAACMSAHDQTAMRCITHARHACPQLDITTRRSSKKEQVTLQMPRETAMRLPLLHDILLSSSTEHSDSRETHNHTHRDATHAHAHGNQQEPHPTQAQHSRKAVHSNLEESLNTRDKREEEHCDKSGTRETRNAQGNSEIPLRLPGSVWALVSLLLILERSVNLWQWLGDVHAEPSLTQQTLEMADFFEASDALSLVHVWLRDVVRYLRPLYSDGAAYTDEKPDSIEHAWSSNPLAVHYLKLLLALSEDHCVFSENSRLACARACARVHARMHAGKSAVGAATVATGVVPMHGNSDTADVDSTPSLKFEDIIGLPTPLKHRWLKHQRSLQIPRSASVNALSSLLPCMSAATHLKTLVVTGVDTAQHDVSTSTFKLMCMSCGGPDGAVFSGALCPDCTSDGQNPARPLKVSEMKSGYPMCHGDDGTCDREVALSIDACWCSDCGMSDSDIFWHKLRTERTYDYVALCAPVCLMEYSLPKLTMLENLEMHGNSVNKYSAARFALMLHACPLTQTLKTLTLCGNRMSFMSPEHKKVLFSAIACMTRLHTLTMPDWHGFVRQHVTCMTPLVAMHSLQKIVVRRFYSHDEGSFPSALHFESMPGLGKCSCGDTGI